MDNQLKASRGKKDGMEGGWADRKWNISDLPVKLQALRVAANNSIRRGDYKVAASETESPIKHENSNAKLFPLHVHDEARKIHKTGVHCCGAFAEEK